MTTTTVFIHETDRTSSMVEFLRLDFKRLQAIVKYHNKDQWYTYENIGLMSMVHLLTTDESIGEWIWDNCIRPNTERKATTQELMLSTPVAL